MLDDQFTQASADIVSFFYAHVMASLSYLGLLLLLYFALVVGSLFKALVIPTRINYVALALLALPLSRMYALGSQVALLGNSQTMPVSLADQASAARSVMYEHAAVAVTLIAYLALQVASLANDGRLRMDWNVAGYRVLVKQMRRYIQTSIPRPIATASSGHPKHD